MAVNFQLPSGFAELLGRFPGEDILLTRLAATDEVFRGICEDLLLAQSTLATLEKLQKLQELPKIAEYRQLVMELSNEIKKTLECAKQSQ